MIKENMIKRNLFIFVILLLGNIFFLENISAVVFLPSGNDIYVDLNRTYPLVLLPLDNNVYNITLNVLENGTWDKFNFTWNSSGSKYQLSIIFSQIGNFPFVVNSTEVTGDIKGTFLVRVPYNITFRFLKDENSIFQDLLPFLFSDRYENDNAFLTAELSGNTIYNPTLEPFVLQLRKPVWHSQYLNGQATIKLYEQSKYAIRLIDGDITFANDYSIPVINKSFGTNIFVGEFTFTNSTSYTVTLTNKELHPFGWLLNYILIILVILIIIIGVILFFTFHDKPSFAVIFVIGGIIALTLLRLILWWVVGY